MTAPVATNRNSATPVLRRALIFGIAFTLGLGALAAVIFFFVDGISGVTSALLGAGIAAIFLGMTAASVLIAQKYDMVVFFAIVMGAWILKFVLFLVAVVLLKNQPWVSPLALFVALIVGVIVSLITDVVVVAKSRMPYASDVKLPSSN